MTNMDEIINKKLAKIFDWAENRLKTIDKEILFAKHYKV
jgi:hypothetical protein